MVDLAAVIATSSQLFSPKTILSHLFYGAVILFLCFWGCPVNKLFHLHCPACGTTRAWMSVLRGDIHTAFLYNAFFWILPFVLLYAAHMNCDFVKNSRFSRPLKLLVMLTGAACFIYNLFRIGGFVRMP